MQQTAKLVIPYTPRPLQKELHDDPARFRVFVCHRRFGKTHLAVNELIRDVVKCQYPRARAAYIAPLYRQAKTIAWQILKDYTIDIPGMKYNESELRADFPNGDRITLYGGDNPHSLRGIYLDSVVMDEVGQMNPTLWTQVVRPALSDRKGRALFIGTPFGMSNLFYRLYERAAELPDWSRRLISVKESKYIDDDELEVVKKEMFPEEYEQEFMCSWSAAIKGAYFSHEMQEAEEQGRITEVPYDKNYPVITSWDLGVSDSTVVWYCQIVGLQVRVIRCEAFQGMELSGIIQQVNSHGYLFSQHIAPHDINVRELGSGSRIRQARNLGISFTVAPMPKEVSRQSGINAVRVLLPKCVFDRNHCKDGIDALKSYRTEYNEQRQVFSNNPLHDWASDYADSFRYFAITKHKNTFEDAGMFGKPDYSQLDLAVV